MDILEKYMENLRLKKNLNYLTMEAYEVDIKDYLSFLEKNNKSIFDLDEELFKKYFEEIEKKYKPSTFIKRYSAVRGIYKYLFRTRQIDKIFQYKLTKGKEKLVKKENLDFGKKEYYEFLGNLPNSFEGMRIKIISKLVAEYNITLINIFEIQIIDLLKYDFQKVVIARNNKIIGYNINKEMEEILKKYYNEYAFEKRFLFGAYSKISFNSEINKYSISYKMLKSALIENDEDLKENIKNLYFEIGIGDE